MTEAHDYSDDGRLLFNVSDLDITTRLLCEETLARDRGRDLNNRSNAKLVAHRMSLRNVDHDTLLRAARTIEQLT